MYIQNDEIRGSFCSISFFLTCLTALSSILGYLNQSKSISEAWFIDEVEVSNWITKNTPRNSLFLTPPNIEWNPVSAKAGRSLFLTQQKWIPFVNVNSTNTDLNHINDIFPKVIISSFL